VRKLFLVLLCLGWVGCTSAVIPNYLPDQQPYVRRYQADFDQTLKAVHESLTDLGWQIEQTADPLVYEQDKIRQADQRDILIMTGVRQTPLFIGTRYAKMNVYIHSQQQESEVEIRYLTITSLPFKNVSSYNNEKAAERILNYIGKILES